MTFKKLAMLLSLYAVTAGAAPSAQLKVQENLNPILIKALKNQLAIESERDADEFSVSVDSISVSPPLANFVPERIRVLALGAQGSRRMDGMFNVSAIAESKTGETRDLTISGLMSVTGPTVVAAVSISRGAIIDAAQLRIIQIPYAKIPTGAAGTKMSSLIGQRMRATANAGEPVYMNLVDPPLAVKNGETVELSVYSGPGVIIRSRGIAKQEGLAGDIIRIEQPDTKKVLMGRIVDTGSVEVRL